MILSELAIYYDFSYVICFDQLSGITFIKIRQQNSLVDSFRKRLIQKKNTDYFNIVYKSKLYTMKSMKLYLYSDNQNLQWRYARLVSIDK